MPEVLDWRRAGDPQFVVERAVEFLRCGRLVAFPTETVYGLAASVSLPDAVKRLAVTKDRNSNKPLALAVTGLDQALEWVPDLGSRGRRLARRCWPGPVTLVSGEGLHKGRAAGLSGAVQEQVCPHGTVGLRAPAHDAILKVLSLMPLPLVLTSANRAGAPEAVTADEVCRAMGEDVALVIDDDACSYGSPSTVARVDGDGCTILREGAVPAATVQRLGCCIVVFVCTGNTCRSPLAEGLFKARLAKKLACRPEDLLERGFYVLSAGIAAMIGAGAAPEAVTAAREIGADLSDHVSRPLTADVAQYADYLITMTQSHLRTLTELFPQTTGTTQLLCPGGTDIADPIGRDQEVYRQCAREIDAHLESLVAEVVRR